MSTAAHDLAHSRTTALVVDEIRAQMARRRLSQVALAKRLGVPQPWLNRRLMGHTPISLDDLDRIAHGLDVTFTELVLAADRNAISLRHGDDKTGWLHGHRAVAMAGWLPRRLRHTREAEIGAHLDLLAPPVLSHAVASIPRPRGATDPIPIKSRRPA